MPCGLTNREIAQSCEVARSTVADYLNRAKAARVTWPEAADLTETEIEERLFPTEHVPSSVTAPAAGLPVHLQRTAPLPQGKPDADPAVAGVQGTTP